MQNAFVAGTEARWPAEACPRGRVVNVVSCWIVGLSLSLIAEVAAPDREIPHVTITEQLHIECPPEVVFDVMADARNETQWNGDVSRAEMTTDGEVGLGSRFITVHGPPLGGIESEITTYQRPERLEFTSTSKRMDLAISLTFAADGTGTMMHGTYTPSPRGVMAILFPLLRPMVRRGMAKQHQRLKALCESGANSPDS